MPVVKINGSSAESGVNIISDGGEDIIEYGICWDTAYCPSVNEFKALEADSLSGRITMDSLISGKTYHVRAYATNINGTGYGEDIAFSTPELQYQFSVRYLYESYNGHVIIGGDILSVTIPTFVTIEHGRTTDYGRFSILRNQYMHSPGFLVFSGTICLGYSDRGTWHLRIKAENVAGVSYSKDFEFQFNYLWPPNNYPSDPGIVK